MKEEKNRKYLGLALVLIGIFFIVMQPISPTGAVIDVSNVPGKIGFLIGLGFLVVGFLIFRVTKKKKKI